MPDWLSSPALSDAMFLEACRWWVGPYKGTPQSKREQACDGCPLSRSQGQPSDK